MNLRALQALLLAPTCVLMVGCQASNNAITLQPSTPAAMDTTPSQQDFGSVEIKVLWPRRVQSIPYSANTMVVKAFNEIGKQAAFAIISRDPSDPYSLGAGSMRLKAGSYVIEASAYREYAPTAASVPVAFSSANAIVRANLKTLCQMNLVALKPTAGGLSAAVGAPGAQVILDTVDYLGRAASSSDVVEVLFGNPDPPSPGFSPSRVPATFSFVPRSTVGPLTGVRRLTDPDWNKLLVTIPAGVNGNPYIYLRVDGVETAVSPFQVIDRMSMSPAIATLQVGKTYAGAGALQTFALGSLTALPPYPVLTWISSAPDVAFVAQDGTVYAYKAGMTTISAVSGRVSASFNLTVTDTSSSASVAVGIPSLVTGGIGASLSIPAYSGTAAAGSN